MKYVIQENECGYLLKNGVFRKLLFAGSYRVSARLGYQVKVVPMTGYVKTCEIPIEVLMAHKDFASRVLRIFIPDNQIAIHFVNDTYQDVATNREAVCWNVFEKNTFQLVDVTAPEMEKTVPGMYRDLMPSHLYKKIEIGEGEVGLLYLDQRFEKKLESGVYYFWNYARKVTCKLFNMKLQQIELSGQEILTADKVGVRLNLIGSYRITDPVRLAQSIDGLKEQLHVYIQLISREFVGRLRLDELLNRKEEVGRSIFERLTEQQEEYCVEFVQAGIRDIILPGEMREIMNTVLLAEKKAQANVITRREEVASTRSLLNTARLMEENKTLYRLKELEYLERICDRVGSISLSGGTGILEQLRDLMSGGGSM